MGRRRFLLGLFAVLLGVAVAAISLLGLSRFGASDEAGEATKGTLEQPPAAAAGSPVGMLTGADDNEGFAHIEGPRRLQFPADHGAHPRYRHEWWYLTGQLQADDGRRFGFQATFFRFATAPFRFANGGEPVRRSAWATDQIYMAHFALTDVDGRRFHHIERFSREALGLAGASTQPLRIWLDDWELTGSEDAFPLRLAIATEQIALSLAIDSRKPPVLQGDAGYSRKGPEAGNASLYYSLTRLQAAGTLRLDGERISVRGQGWFDHEWGSSALGPDVRGWDWFSLQLADGRELMFFHLRHDDGTIDPLSHGSLVQADGSSATLTLSDVTATPVRWWSADTGERYPVEWTLSVPTAQLNLRIAAVLDDQLWRGRFRYWEGGVRVLNAEDRAVVGEGYVELTGY